MYIMADYVKRASVTKTQPQLELEKYLHQNRAFYGRRLRIHDKSKDHRFR